MSDEFGRSPSDLSTDRVRLRALTLDDAPAVFAYASKPEVARFTLWRPHASELFTKGFIKVLTQPQFMNWAMVLPPSESAIGMVFLHSFSKQHQRAEVAFNLSPSHWNQGLMTEAAGAVLQFAFQSLGLNRIEATVMPENQSSRRVLEKLGLRFEGTMRKSHSRYDGFHDMDLFAVIRHD